MRFTRLRLNGFKSFVDPTDLIIAEGLTGVVGPNGCGKSNLLEALRWVMGENRPTAMRGGGMEDVIFAGAATRPARNYAEVALVIDNTERLAPAGFNDSDSLEVIRRITRDAGSAYKVGQKEVRARDVQMLFADASTGSHSPALVRQGQISELINSRPQARRMILEEAAGISGLYQRRHEAELKLKGAEQNLTRVDDVIEALAVQIQSLVRQARAAVRYREIGAQLRHAEGLLLYRRWREADEARVATDAQLREATLVASRAEAATRLAITAREEADKALPLLREEEAIAGAILQRLTVSRDALTEEEQRAAQKITTLRARIDQLTRDIERETGLTRDAGETMARLECEAREIARAAEGHDTRLETAADSVRQVATDLQDLEAELGRATEDAARLAARHQSAQRLIDDNQRLLAKGEAEALRSGGGLREAEAALSRAQADLTTATSAEEAAVATARRADETLLETEAARAETQGREAEARAQRSEAEGEANALRAEVAALARLVARDTKDSGQVLDLLTVYSGFEKALGAALADDLRAPRTGAEGRSGWAALPAYAVPQPLPDGVRPLAEVVKVPDVLVRRIGQVGLVARADGPRLQAALLPGQRLVSTDGDLWRWDGFRAGAEDAPSAAALRLQQLNRLVELKRDLEEVAARATGAALAHDLLSKRLAALTEADRQARQARRDADRLVAEAGRALSRAEADRSIAEGKRDALTLALARHEEEIAAARAALADAEMALAALGDLGAARAAVETVKTTVESARALMMARRSTHDEILREGEARTRRLQEITKDISGWRHRLETAGVRSIELADRKTTAEAELAEAVTLPATLAKRRADLTDSIAAAEDRRRKAADALSAAETVLRNATQAERDAERAGSEAREARARAEARADAARESVTLAAERILEAQDVTPGGLLDRVAVDPAAMPAADVIESQISALRRQREALGAVNLRAEEDAKEVQTEHDALVNEKADLESAIKALRSGIASLNREGRERLLTAFEQVNDNFALLFTHLFGGGEAKLVLIESDDPLEAGLEIMCQPPGKKLSTLSLLSGGEQTLTAMALIFAVFLANPAPICVLDEVDAPLDDANVTRFCDLLDEMARRTETRFLIITHHAVTMSRMDRLFGVTMGEQGVSQLVSVDLKKAEGLVA
jgi:chromosome segregation protein